MNNLKYIVQISQHFHILKSIDNFEKLTKYTIPLDDDIGFLLPACKLHFHNDKLISLLAEWRSKNSFAFPTKFKITKESTINWLENIVYKNEARILFFVLNSHRVPIGHLGYANCINDNNFMEIDNVVRGVKEGDSGIMTYAMKSLLKWGLDNFSPARIYLRVFSDNEHAITFYRKLGFIDLRLIPLYRFKKPGVEYFESIEAETRKDPDKFYLEMVYKNL